MKRMNAIAVLLIALAGPALAANTPVQLVQALTKAAHNGDVRGFLANMSVSSQLAFTDADATQAGLVEAQKKFQAALDERFGKGHQVQPPPPTDGRKAVLSRLVDIELVSVYQKTPNEAQLRLKTITKDTGGRLVTEENTFPAVKEGGEWKLELTELARGTKQAAAQRTSAYDGVTREIYAGVFKDRLSALIGLAKAERGQAGRAGK
jgi:hypothetical protein